MASECEDGCHRSGRRAVTYFHGGSIDRAPGAGAGRPGKPCAGPEGEGGEAACARQGRREANHSSTEFLRRRDTRIPVRERNAVAIKTLGYISRVRNIISSLSAPIT